MGRWSRIWVGAAGAVFLLLGLGCLNYTRAETRDHHLEAAARLGLPPPGPGIHWLGMVATTLGAGVVGFAVGRRRPSSSPGS
jgi:hypothetical protein